jgi:hypothetical protein
VLSQELECLWRQTTTVLLEWTIPKAVDMSLLHFYCIRNILYRIVWILYRNVYVLYVQYRYTRGVHMSTIGVVIHCTEWGCQSPNPQEINNLSGHFVFHFHDVFQERNSGLKRDLPVFYIFTGSWWPDLLDSVEGLCSMELVS